MMRALFASSLLVCTLLMGCSETTTTADMAVAADMTSHAVHDMAGATDTCAAILGCITTTCTTAATYTTCVQGCVAKGSTTAQGYYATLGQCVGSMCINLGDGGAGPCVDPLSTACGTCAATACGAQLAACNMH